MNNEIFFGKIIVNALDSWVNSFGDEAIIRSIVEHTAYLHGKWSEDLKARKEKALEAEAKDTGYKLSFVALSKLLTKDDVAEMVREIRAMHPLMDGPFELSSSTTTLAELLDLTQTEAVMLECSARLYDGIDYDIYRTLQKIHEMEKLRDKVEFTMQVFEASREDAQSAHDGFLVKSGLVTDSRGPSGFWNLNSDIAPAFTMKDMTSDKIEAVLFPASISTSLTVEDYPHVETEIARTHNAIEEALSSKSTGMNIMLWGEPGTGKSELALAMAKKFGWNMKIVGDISPIDTSEKSRGARLASLKLATKLLARDDRAVILFDEMEDLFKTDNNAAFSKAFINRIIETSPVPIIWTTNSLYALGNAVLRRMVFNINLEVPGTEHRAGMWRKYSEQYGLEIDEKTITGLADTYDIAPALIHNAAKVARSALGQEGARDSDAIAEIVASLDRLVNYGLKRSFQKPTYDDTTDYDPSCSNTDRNLDDFTARLLKARPHFSLLLFGPSGTGKSEYGKYLAFKLGRKVLYKKASDLLDKFVGGTEEKIAEAFAEAKKAGKVLLIDEGDTFLRNRERAERSWEVSQVNQMLTEMEQHDHPFIMTTNLKDDLDSAAMRRFTFKLHFDYMTSDMADRLFTRMWKKQAPKALSKLSMLTPGDFANVRRQAEVLDVTEASELYEMLVEEVKQKPNGQSPIGF